MHPCHVRYDIIWEKRMITAIMQVDGFDRGKYTKLHAIAAADMCNFATPVGDVNNFHFA